jgi:TRAP-type C4-dicarboxylate transport system permease small subunit
MLSKRLDTYRDFATLIHKYYHTGGFTMKWLLIALGAVLLLWLISLLIQRKDKVTREKLVKQHLEEKKKEEEAQSKSPFTE